LNSIDQEIRIEPLTLRTNGRLGLSRKTTVEQGREDPGDSEVSTNHAII